MLSISRNVQSLKSTTPVTVAGSLLILSDHFKSLRVTTNTSLTFDQHTRNSCKNWYAVFDNYYIMAMNNSIANAMACAIVGYRQDYYNEFLVGMYESNLD